MTDKDPAETTVEDLLDGEESTQVLSEITEEDWNALMWLRGFFDIAPDNPVPVEVMKWAHMAIWVRLGTSLQDYIMWKRQTARSLFIGGR